MRKISAQFVITAADEPLKRGVVTVSDDNTILSVENTSGKLEETAGTEFYNGILIPAFVNCHCHLELSHMHGTIPGGNGLSDFITAVRETRETSDDIIISAAEAADNMMFNSGIAACADISNNSLTFKTKKKSKIEYTTFIEAFGIDASKAGRRIDNALEVAAAAVAAGLRHHITPHAVYSVSRDLFTRLLNLINPAPLTSLHFLETDEEREMVGHRRGRLAESYKSLGVTPESIDIPDNHVEVARALAEISGKLILVHNTCITETEVAELAAFDNILFCLCPSSNRFISGKIPPLNLFKDIPDRIIIGTDSLASNKTLSILEELKLLQDENKDISLDQLIRWGTISGAKAMLLDEKLGSIEPGKRPGLLLIENADLKEMRITPKSSVRRLL